MGRTHPTELRTRVVEFVEEGYSHRAAARHFWISTGFVNDMVKLRAYRGQWQSCPDATRWFMHSCGGRI